MPNSPIASSPHNSLIPKVIHYCWFGGKPMPELALKCIESWKKYLPDYELRLWNEETFDINSVPYVKEAYEARKFAFVTDYIRLWALEREGGVYMDTDVEVLRPLDDLLHLPAFTGYEASMSNAPVTGLMASAPHGVWVREQLAYYDDNRHFRMADGTLDMTPNTITIARIMQEGGFVIDGKYGVYKDDLHVFPVDYFCPLTSTRVLKLTKNTYCIHHFAGSWVELTLLQKVKQFVTHKVLGTRMTDRLVQIKRHILASKSTPVVSIPPAQTTNYSKLPEDRRIPKTLHYCWFGGEPMPKIVEQCIESWHEYMPTWKYQLWNEENFDLYTAPRYVQEAYESKHYAFVSDYVRLWALEREGGLYMDVDFMVFKPFDDLMEAFESFMGFEGSKQQPVMLGVMAAVAHHPCIKAMMLTYESRTFVLANGSYDLTPNTGYFRPWMQARGFVADGKEKDFMGVHIFPVDYFSPILTTGESVHSQHTYCEHKRLRSWNREEGWKHQLLNLFGVQIRIRLIQIKRKLFG